MGTYVSDLWNAGGSGAQGGMANLSDAVGYAANKVGLDSLRDTAHNWARSWERDARNRMGRVVDPEGFGNRVAGGMGSSLSMMIPAAVVGGVGALSGGTLSGLLGLAVAGTLIQNMGARRNSAAQQAEVVEANGASAAVPGQVAPEVSPPAAGGRQRRGKKTPKPS